MTSRAQVRRGILPRDEIMTRGLESRRRHNHPWMYSAKVKSGRKRTIQVVKEAYNQTDLFGQIVGEHAEPEQDLFVYHIVKIMKNQARIKDY
jgi:hypothetical protein